MNCKKCGAALMNDDIGLNRKMISRDTQSFLCLNCLAAYFGCEKELLEKKILQFKASGCAMFVSK